MNEYFLPKKNKNIMLDLYFWRQDQKQEKQQWLMHQDYEKKRMNTSLVILMMKEYWNISYKL